MMENLPPFYVGQKIVRIVNSSNSKYKIGDEHICYGCIKCVGCGNWSVDVGIRVERFCYVLLFACNCNWKMGMSEPIQYFDAKSFAPIEKNFQSISLEKVLEEETKLISVN